MASVWANEDTLNKLSDIYKNTTGSAEERVKSFAKGVVESLEGFEGSAKNQWKSFEGKTGDASEKLAKLILGDNISKKETKKVNKILH